MAELFCSTGTAFIFIAMESFIEFVTDSRIIDCICRKRVSEAQKRGKLLIDQITWLSACFQRCYFINFTYIFWKKKKKL